MKNNYFIKKTILILLMIITFSCKENKTKKINPREADDSKIQEIGHLYQPEKINAGPIKNDINLKKKNYEITLYNSDLLQKDKKVLKEHSKKIALLYKKYLLQNNFNYNAIIITIHNKNGEKYNFKYSDAELIKIEQTKN